MTLVLAGGLADETGHYGPGEVAFAGRGLAHRPMADRGHPCVAYIVSDAQPVFTGLLGLLDPHRWFSRS